MYILIKKILVPLFFLFLTLIFFSKILIHPNEMLYPAGDMSIYSFRESFLVDSIKNFSTLPLWNPYMFGGQPTLSSSEIPPFYPFHFLFFFLPIDSTFGYLFILDIFLFGIFSYLFVRKIGLDKLSALTSAFIATFSGTTMLYIYPGQISILDGFIWLPLLLLFCELIIQKKLLLNIVFLGIIVGLMLLSGTLQISLINLFSAFSFFTFRLFFLKINKLRSMLALLLSIMIGLLLAAIQLLPALEFTRLSTRSNGLDYLFASDFSLHPYQLITFFLPHFFGSPTINNTYWGINGNFWSLCGYIGIFPLILSAIAIFYKRNKYTIFFICIGIFSLLFSFGRFGVVFSFFYNFVPGFNFFRVPGRFLFIYSFSMSVLAGFGMSTLLNNTKAKIPANILRFIIILFLVSLSFFLVIYFNKQNLMHFLNSRGYALGNNLNGIHSLIVKDTSALTLLLFFSSLLLLALMKKLLTKSKFFILTFLVILLDLWFFDFKFYNTKNPKEIFKNSTEITQIMKDKTTFRVFDFKGNVFPLTGRNRIESLTGYDALYLSYYRDFLWLSGDHANTPYESFFTFYNIHNLNILRLLNTKYILASKDVFVFDKTDVDQINPNLYRIKETLPRAYIIPNAIIAKDKNSVKEYLKDVKFNFKKNVILEKKPSAPISNASLYKEINSLRYGPNRIEMKVNMQNSGFLVLSEIWYPGWKAYVNNKQTEIYKANMVFRSIYLDKGPKNIVFIFDPWTFKAGKAISIFTLTIILFYTAFYIKYVRSKQNDE